METMIAFLMFGAGLLVRLAVPILVTLALIYFLRRLDIRWQREASHVPASAQKPECWDVKDCSPEQRQECAAFSSPLPCWQLFRLPNDYLREDCLSCEVFSGAPIPRPQSAVPISKLEA
jgi:hypothetical protein